MIHLIWSTINGIVILYFLYLLIGFIVKGKSIFKKPFKAFTVFMMVIGIIQIISISTAPKDVNRITIRDNYNENNSSKIKEVVLEDNLTFIINMTIKYSIDQNEYTPIESWSGLSGLVMGYVWDFKSINTDAFFANEKANFTAKGTLKWKLFGITVYTEPKTFKGMI
ncbi:MAG: hypothetical protein AAGJ93_00570 [Bacteroidota bacterium]